MKQQYELPAPTPEELCAKLSVPFDASTKVSGGQIINLRDAWAMDIFGGGKVSHFFKRDAQSDSVIADQIDTATSLCKLTAPVRTLYGAGNYDRCSRCQQQWQRLAFSKV